MYRQMADEFRRALAGCGGSGTRRPAPAEAPKQNDYSGSNSAVPRNDAWRDLCQEMCPQDSGHEACMAAFPDLRDRPVASRCNEGEILPRKDKWFLKANHSCKSGPGFFYAIGAKASLDHLLPRGFTTRNQRPTNKGFYVYLTSAQYRNYNRGPSATSKLLSGSALDNVVYVLERYTRKARFPYAKALMYEVVNQFGIIGKFASKSVSLWDSFVQNHPSTTNAREFVQLLKENGGTAYRVTHIMRDNLDRVWLYSELMIEIKRISERKPRQYLVSACSFPVDDRQFPS